MFTKRFVLDIVVVACFIILGVYYRANIQDFIHHQQNYWQPCSTPLTYNIGQFDTKFGVSKSNFNDALTQAIKIWEGAIDKKLFVQAASGQQPDFTINLIYDYRQQGTNQLQKINSVISQDKNGTTSALEMQYNTLVSSYNTQKQALDTDIAEYNTDKAAYEHQVAYWNAKGGAPADEYAKLEQQKNDVNTKGANLQQEQATLNVTAKQINDLAATLNQSIHNLNAHINEYNAVASSIGEQFNEGEYIRDAQGQRINIYQFDNKAKMVRVLAHELGHALGLEHIDDPKAIMYKLNQGSTDSLTASDLTELKAVCHIQ